MNARVRVNVAFGGSLTKVKAMPQGASRTLDDPFADKKSRWPSIIVLIGLLLALLYILNQKGLIHEWTGGVIGKSPVVTGTVQGGGGMSPKTVVR